MNIREIIKEVRYIYYFSGGLAFFRAKDEKGSYQGLIDQAGEIVWGKWRNLALRLSGHPDYIKTYDKQTKELIYLNVRTLQFESEPEWHKAEMQTPAWQIVNNAPMVEFIKGVETMFDYKSMHYLNETYIGFAQEDSNRTSDDEERSRFSSLLNPKWGVQDLEGNIIIPAVFDSVSGGDRPNRFIVKRNDKKGVIDDHMKWIIPCEYSSVICYAPHNAYVAYDEKPRRKPVGGMLDTEGNLIMPFLYEHIFPSPTEDSITVKRRGRWKVINSKGEKLFDIGK